MLRLIVGLFACFWIGIVVAEIAGKAGLPGTDNTLIWGAGAAALFLASEIVQRLLHRYLDRAADDSRPKRLLSAYHLVLGVLCLCLLAGIPWLWWGVMKELAGVAGR